MHATSHILHLNFVSLWSSSQCLFCCLPFLIGLVSLQFVLLFTALITDKMLHLCYICMSVAHVSCLASVFFILIFILKWKRNSSIKRAPCMKVVLIVHFKYHKLHHLRTLIYHICSNGTIFDNAFLILLFCLAIVNSNFSTCYFWNNLEMLNINLNIFVYIYIYIAKSLI